MMNTDFIKPAIWGAVGGAAALAIVGFGWGGWHTGGQAEKLANDRARTQVVAALTPLCLSASKADPQAAARLTELKNLQSYQRTEKVVENGWATVPGGSEANRDVATACQLQLTAT